MKAYKVRVSTPQHPARLLIVLARSSAQAVLAILESVPAACSISVSRA